MRESVRLNFKVRSCVKITKILNYQKAFFKPPLWWLKLRSAMLIDHHLSKQTLYPNWEYLYRQGVIVSNQICLRWLGRVNLCQCVFVIFFTCTILGGLD